MAYIQGQLAFELDLAEKAGIEPTGFPPETKLAIPSREGEASRARLIGNVEALLDVLENPRFNERIERPKPTQRPQHSNGQEREKRSPTHGLGGPGKTAREAKKHARHLRNQAACAVQNQKHVKGPSPSADKGGRKKKKK